MKTLLAKTMRILALPLLLWLTATGARAQTALHVYDFNIDLGPKATLEHAHSLGFRGLATRVRNQAELTRLRRYARHAEGIGGFQLLPFVRYDFTSPGADALWRGALPILASTRAPLWVIFKDAPNKGAIRQVLREMARQTRELGLQTVIYPHWNTSVETAAEAATLIQQVGYPNLKNSIHTCHEIRGGNQYQMGTVVSDHADQTALVTIAGADDNAYVGPNQPGVTWADCIKPLDEGAYSLLPFLQAIHDSGYRGPVVLQTFGITNNPGHLERSIRRYDEYQKQVVRESE